MIIISWKNYFARKGWDPKLWARARNVRSHEQCCKLMGKMKISTPSYDEYVAAFKDPVVKKPVDNLVSGDKVNKSSLAVNPENMIPKPKPEPEPMAKPKAKPKAKSKVKQPTTVKAVDKNPIPVKDISGTSSLINSVKKPSRTKRATKKRTTKTAKKS